MKIEDLDKISTIQKLRAQVIGMRKSAYTGHLDFRIVENGTAVHPLSAIGAEAIRQAVIEATTDVIADLTDQLRRLGVQIAAEPIADMDAAGWRRTAETYLRVWIRELGGSLIHKRHLIDALALTTSDMRERMEKAEGEVKRLQAALDHQEAINGELNEMITRIKLRQTPPTLPLDDELPPSTLQFARGKLLSISHGIDPSCYPTLVITLSECDLPALAAQFRQSAEWLAGGWLEDFIPWLITQQIVARVPKNEIWLGQFGDFARSLGGPA